jgi:hypothetical protein
MADKRLLQTAEQRYVIGGKRASDPGSITGEFVNLYVRKIMGSCWAEIGRKRESIGANASATEALLGLLGDR